MVQKLIPFLFIFSSINIALAQSFNGIIKANDLKNQPTFIIIDVSKPNNFKKDHIPGSINLWRPDITNIDTIYKGLIASEYKIDSLTSALNITKEDTIVVYDHKGGCDAVRLKWVLNQYNFPNVSLLDGGIIAWENSSLDLSIDKSISNYSKPNLNLNIDLNELKVLLVDTNTILIDTRTLDEFEGNNQKKGAYRAGRIPGAIHIDWASCINYNGNQKLKSSKDLKTLFESKGVTKNKTIICYCHSGVRSAHTTFVLNNILSYPNVKNYDGSWVEWSYFKDLPIETGQVESKYKEEKITNKTLITILSIVFISLLIALLRKLYNKLHKSKNS